MASRRAFLATLLAASSAPALGWAAAGSPAFLACAREADGTFALHGLGPDGQSRFAVPLPARGHAGAGHPRRAEAVVFARRPGAFALVVDCVQGAVLRRLTPPAGRQLNGHGAFVGNLLVTSEQVADTSEGVLGLWDGATHERLGEVPTGGLGPHDVRTLPDGRLVVANSGIATDPTDRTKLNVPTMRPSLAVLDLAGGIEPVDLGPEMRQASIRHLAVRADGLVAFAMQWEGPAEVVVPLLGLWRPGEAPVLATAPESEAALVQGYLGSVTFSGDGSEVVATSPRGGRAQRFGAAGAFLGSLARTEVCGVAPLGAGVLLSDGLGGLLALEGGEARPLGLAPRAWDNHVVAL